MRNLTSCSIIYTRSECATELYIVWFTRRREAVDRREWLSECGREKIAEKEKLFFRRRGCCGDRVAEMKSLTRAE